MKKILLITALLLSLFSCKKEMGIAVLGEKTPNYNFTNLLNTDNDELNLRDLKGKIVILEFWATWCGPCIPAMKKLDKLQVKFKNDLEVITVSSENVERLEKYIKTSQTKLVIASDTIHNSNFKYKIIPHSIIIDKKGIVRAITNPENINEEVIKTLISDNEIDLELKDDFFIDPNLDVKLIAAENTSNYTIELKNYDQEKGGYSKFLTNADGEINGIEIANTTVPRLYQTLFDVSSPNRMIFKDGMSYDKDFPYEKEYQYNFTIQSSLHNGNDWKKIGVNFLNKHFDVNAKMSIDSLECFVLKKEKDIIQKSQSEESEYQFRGTVLRTKKVKISTLVEYLENFSSLPIVDVTGLKDEYDIQIEWQFEDPKTLHSELKKYGFKLEKSTTKMPVEVMEIYKKQL